MVEERRSLLMLILLNIITCGIYSIFWYNDLAKDMNTVCYNDGEDTPGVGYYILFSILTCGFYSYYWFYKVANRQQANAQRYGVNITENGTTVLMWMIFGMLLFFIGGYVALYIVIKNMNLLAAAYNQRHHGGGNFAPNNYNPNNYNPSNNNQTSWTNKRTEDFEKTAPMSIAAGNGIILCCGRGEFAGCEFPIGMNETVVIGRSMSCNIKFDSNTPNVSRVHCELTYDGRVWITDRGSSFGTFLSNGTKLISGQRTELTTGFYLGNGEISFYIK